MDPFRVPVPGHVVYGTPADLAFTIEGTAAGG